MSRITSSSESISRSVQAPAETYQPPQLQDLGKWQAVTLVISLPTGPGSNAFNDPDAFFKKVEW